MNIGIIGSDYSINRHLISLKKLDGIHISGLYQSGKSHKDFLDFYNIPYYKNHDQLIEDSDSLVISDHNGCFNSKIAVNALRRGKHVFIYPHLVRSINEAAQLTKLASEANVILKVGTVGHLNLNPLLKIVNDTSGLNFIDIQYNRVYVKTINSNPVFDALLVISQAVSSLVRSQLHSVKAKGLPVASERPDIVNARLEFNNGCLVNINSNIVAATDDFKGTIVKKDTCISFDLVRKKFTFWNMEGIKNDSSEPSIVKNTEPDNNDLLFEELKGFVASAALVPENHSSNDSGFEPYILTERILEKVRKMDSTQQS